MFFIHLSKILDTLFLKCIKLKACHIKGLSPVLYALYALYALYTSLYNLREIST